MTQYMDSPIDVIKRSGAVEPFSSAKLFARIRRASSSIPDEDIHKLVHNTWNELKNNITTVELDEYLASQCAKLCSLQLYYGELASAIIHTCHHKNTSPDFYATMHRLYYFVDAKGHTCPLISTGTWNYIEAHRTELQSMLDYSRDFLIDYFGFKTLLSKYLLQDNNVTVERVQHLWMRVAIEIHHLFSDSLSNIRETYFLISNKYYIHATPTLFNSCSIRPQLSSCFLVAMEADSIDGIFNTLKDCALISKYAGGIAVNIHNIRAKNSFIRGTNGTSNGIVPMLRVFNNVSLYCDQGGGKRKGSIVAYLEPWHADVCDFLFMKKNHGDEYLKARELFYAMWVPDLFMQRLLDDKDWSLFCPDECPGLADTYGDEFAALYTKYETEGKHRGKIQARELWFKILDAQMETGMPYLLFKDAANKKSNQKNIGTIKSSNLCCEIMEYSDATETAVCNLASIALPRFVNPQTRQFNYAMLHDVTKTVAFNLNRIIDITYYPTDKAKKSNVRHRPIGIGVQGLADMFILMNIAFHSDEAKTVNRLVFETIYHAALEQSSEQAEIDGPYETFHGSPASQGVLQYDMWGVVPTPNRYDWDALKERIKRDGLRNSLLVSLMPTASTSQILGYNECFEPFTANIYSRRVLAGEYTVVNKYMMRELQSLGMWSEDIKQSIIANNGSIQHLTILPEHVRNKYKTVWEIPMRHIIQMSVDRGAFICQSQSLNLWMEEPNYAKLTSMHIFSWKAGLKTGVYYMRRRAKYTAQQFTVEPVCTECSA